MAKVLILKNPFHHEGHRDHEDFLWDSIIWDTYQKADIHFLSAELFYFAVFVFFVV